MEYENYSFPEALKYLADRVGIKLPEREYSEEEKRQQDLRMQVLEINKMAANYFYYQLRTESGAQAMQYLKSRQLDDETIKRFAPVSYTHLTLPTKRIVEITVEDET